MSKKTIMRTLPLLGYRLFLQVGFQALHGKLIENDSAVYRSCCITSVQTVQALLMHYSIPAKSLLDPFAACNQLRARASRLNTRRPSCRKSVRNCPGPKSCSSGGFSESQAKLIAGESLYLRESLEQQAENLAKQRKEQAVL